MFKILIQIFKGDATPKSLIKEKVKKNQNIIQYTLHKYNM